MSQFNRPRHLAPMQDFNHISEVKGFGNGNGMSQASPEITNQANIGTLNLLYQMTQIIYTHLRGSKIDGRITIELTPTAGGAVLTEFDWTWDVNSGPLDVDKINFQTGNIFSTVAAGADGTCVGVSCTPQSASVIRFSMTPPAGAPIQTYMLATAPLRSELNF